MSNFLKNVIKETGNEYGTIVSDGLATADVSGYVDTGSFMCLMLCAPVLYMVGYLKIRSQRLQASRQQARHSLS